MIRKLLFLMSTLLLIQPIWGQQISDCEVLFKKATEKVRSLQNSLVARGFEMNARVVITALSGDVLHENMEIKCGRDRYQYITDQVELYQDANSLVVVQKDQQSIFVTRPLSEKRRQNQFNNVLTLQDSLKKYLRLTICAKEFGTVERNVGYLRMVFEGGDELKQAGLESIAYWLDPEKMEVRKIMITYTPDSGYELNSYEMIVDTMNYAYEGSPFPGDAMAMIMYKGKLKSEYQSYQLIDKRL